MYNAPDIVVVRFPTLNPGMMSRISVKESESISSRNCKPQEVQKIQGYFKSEKISIAKAKFFSIRLNIEISRYFFVKNSSDDFVYSFA